MLLGNCSEAGPAFDWAVPWEMVEKAMGNFHAKTRFSDSGILGIWDFFVWLHSLHDRQLMKLDLGCLCQKDDLMVNRANSNI